MIRLRYASIGLIFIWIIYVLGACLENHSDLDLGNVIWAIIWCIINIACFAGVLYALDKKKMHFLIPALCLSVFNIVAGIINAIINFTTFSWFAAVWLLVILRGSSGLRLSEFVQISEFFQF